MSEMASEARPKAGGKKENVFTRKLGPLPMWAWAAIASVIILGYFYLKNKQSGSSSGSSSTAGAGQVPQFVNQTYTSLIAPGAPHDHDRDRDGTGDKDRDRDRDGKGKRKLIPFKDESKKDKRIRTWEHKHHQEYPFNTWQGNPTDAQLDWFTAHKDEYQPPSMGQSDQFPGQMGRQTGPLIPPTHLPEPVSGVDNGPSGLVQRG